MRIALAVGAALFAVGACSQTPRVEVDPETGRVDVDVEPTGQRGEGWTATLSPRGGSGTSGTAAAHVMDDMTHVTITISGSTAGTHPWHVHEGTCGTPNAPIVGSATAYPPLQVGGSGSASAQAHLSGVELNEARRYHVNVHASPTNLSTIIACGELDD